MKLTVENYYSNDFEIRAEDENGYTVYSYDDMIDDCKISPFDFYEIFVKNGAKWSTYERCYTFSNRESAKKVIDEIESYLILNKLSE